MKNFNLFYYKQPVDFTDIELTVKEAVISKCHECCAYQSSEVKACDCKTCSLYKFKLKWYKTPTSKVLSDEYRKDASERFKKWWQNKKETDLHISK